MRENIDQVIHDALMQQGEKPRKPPTESRGEGKSKNQSGPAPFSRKKKGPPKFNKRKLPR